MDVNALKLKLATGAQIQIKDHCPNTAVDYPEQAHSRYFTVFAVLYNHGTILCYYACMWPIRKFGALLNLTPVTV